MTLLFTSPPPKFSKKDILILIKNEYSMDGIISNCESDRDQNFLLTTNDGKYLFKIYNNHEHLDTIKMQRSLIKFLIRNNFKYKIPKPFGNIGEILKEDIVYYSSMFHFIDGEQLSNKKLGFENYREMGIFLGNFSKTVSMFKHKNLSRHFEWDTRQIKYLEHRLKYIENKQNRMLVSSFIAKYYKAVEEVKLELRYSFIHNDANNQNILIHPNGKIKGIIDFGDVTYSYTMLEAAVCMSYIGRGHNDPIKVWESFLEGYLSKFQLKEKEIKLLPIMISARICLSIIMCSWRKKMFPENTYLTISEKTSWELLNFLEENDPISLFVKSI